MSLSVLQEKVQIAVCSLKYGIDNVPDELHKERNNKGSYLVSKNLGSKEWPKEWL